jgi:hypothetical protein
MVYLTQEWDSFDTWCLSRGIDADALTSRRLVNVAWAHLTEGLDEEHTNRVAVEAERIGNRFLEGISDESSPIPDVAPPPGWRSDEDNWANIQGALAQMGTLNKGVNR